MHFWFTYIDSVDGSVYKELGVGGGGGGMKLLLRHLKYYPHICLYRLSTRTKLLRH